MRPVGDRSQSFILALLVSWVGLIGLPLVLSLMTGNLYGGLPALGVVLWFVLLRVARWISPPVRADRLMRRGRYAEAIVWCDRALSIAGPAAWRGPRRLIWLTRKSTAELALSRGSEALTTADEALTISGDPQTVSTAAAALLLLNRYDEAETAARLALRLTRERSVSANATMAAILLARQLPVEAEAHARAGLADIEMLLPMVKPEHYVASLLTLSRALRTQGHVGEGRQFLRRCVRVARRRPVMLAMAKVEQAEYSSLTPSEQVEAVALLREAAREAPEYLRWYARQPKTLALLRDVPEVAALLARLDQQIVAGAPQPTLQWVHLALEKASHTGRMRPAPQSSQEALTAQLVLLGGTAVILAVWAWHFYLSAAS